MSDETERLVFPNIETAVAAALVLGTAVDVERDRASIQLSLGADASYANIERHSRETTHLGSLHQAACRHYAELRKKAESTRKEGDGTRKEGDGTNASADTAPQGSETAAER